MGHYASFSRPSLTALDWSTACMSMPAIRVATGNMCFPVREPRAPDVNWLRVDSALRSQAVAETVMRLRMPKFRGRP